MNYTKQTNTHIIRSRETNKGWVVEVQEIRPIQRQVLSKDEYTTKDVLELLEGIEGELNEADQISDR